MSEITAPITLVTGLPGAGKTAHAVDLMAHHPDYQGRPLFVMGIAELKVPHFEVPPVKEWTELRPDKDDPSVLLNYFTFPPRSVVVIDEAQRIFRPRPVGSKVPPEVQAFETVRHTGVDFILLTQHPGLLDSNIKKLVGRHMHVHIHPLGRKLLEWRGCKDPDSRADRDLAASKAYKPPKRVFGLYKSAEVHTKVSVGIPFQYYLFAFAALCLLAVSFYAYQRFTAKSAPAAHDATPKAGPGGGGAAPIPTREQYIAAWAPRVAGLLHTAPVFDDVAKVKEAPWPSGCIKSTKRCQCYDQQGNHYATTDAVCGQIIAHGMFKPFGEASPKAPVVGGGAPSGRPAVGGEVAPAVPVQVADSGELFFRPKK